MAKTGSTNRGLRRVISRLKAPVLLLVICFAIGWSISDHSQVATEGATFSSVSRDPAAIRSVFDFSSLQGSELYSASAQRLISGAKILHEKQDLGLQLGHFVVKGSSGEKEFACQKYGQLILFFEAEGMAVNGERPKMEVEGACEISKDINSMSPLWIPTAKILGEPVADGEFDFRDERVVKIRFSNVSDEWPKSWQLKSIKLVGKAPADEPLYVTEQDLSESSSGPFLIHFTQ